MTVTFLASGLLVEMQISTIPSGSVTFLIGGSMLNSGTACKQGIIKTILVYVLLQKLLLVLIIKELSLTCIINHPLPSTVRVVIGTLTCTSMDSISTSDSKCY